MVSRKLGMKSHKRHFLFILALIVVTKMPYAQRVYEISVCDLAPNYGINCELLNDTNALHTTLKQFHFNKAQVEMECDNLLHKVRNMRRSLKYDYELRDGKLWIDQTVFVSDFAQYDSILDNLQERIINVREYYANRAERERDSVETAHKARVDRERQRRQQELDQRATTLKDSIGILHNKIFSACNNKDNLSKKIVKERKDIFYAYLSIYNKQDLTLQSINREYLIRLRDLLQMQRNLLDSVLGEHGYPLRIDAFPNRLKERCGRKHTEVYRSYLKSFNQPTVAVNFNNIVDYYRYTRLLKNIVSIQEGYLASVSLRDSIMIYKDSIFETYKNKYRPIGKIYEDCASHLALVPAFSNVEDKDLFLEQLEGHLMLQKAYMRNHEILEQLENKANRINSSCGNLREVKKTFSMIPQPYDVLPDFCDVSESATYDSTLSRIDQMQDIYKEIIALRKTIDTNEQQIMSGKHTERVFIRGYKTIKSQVELTPSCITVYDGKRFTKSLQDFAELQKRCIITVAQSDAIANNEKKIVSYEKVYPNIYKAYKTLIKSMSKSEINNLKDLQTYQMAIASIQSIQSRFIAILNSSESQVIDGYLVDENDVNHIRLLLKIQ